MPSGAYTASELDAITDAEQRDALAEESKSFMERLGFTQPTQADLTPAFPGLDPNAYFDPLGVGGAQIARSRPFQAASALGVVPGPLGVLGSFLGATGSMAEARAVDRTREMYGLPTTRSYQRSYQPEPRGSLSAGIGQFFGLGTDRDLFDEAELADPSFAGYLGDVGAETGARSRPAPDYTGTTGYAPGDRAWDQYAYEYGKELENWNKEMAFATNIPEGPEKAELISYYSKLHPAHRLADIEKQAYFNSLDEPDFGIEPGAMNALELAMADPTSGYRTADLDAAGGYEQQEINRAAIAQKEREIEHAEIQDELIEYDPEAYEDNGEEQGLGYSADYGDWSGLGY
jgi:hypothetical protein